MNISENKPLLPFVQDVAEKVEINEDAVARALKAWNIEDDVASRPLELLTIRRLYFNGEKRGSKLKNGPLEFEWNDLKPGLWGVLSEGTNQVGKSTVLEVMLWSLRGRSRNLKPEVRAWIQFVELNFKIGHDTYKVEFTNSEGKVSGTLIADFGKLSRILSTFNDDSEFELVMNEFMMKRFGLQPIPTVKHGTAGSEPSTYNHAWSAYAASMYIEGAHPAILGDVTIGALWWRMLHLFIGLPYAGIHMSIRNAVTLEQARTDNLKFQQIAPQSVDADISRLESLIDQCRASLALLGDDNISWQKLDELLNDNANLSSQEVALQSTLTNASLAANAGRKERDEARTSLRRLKEGQAAKRAFSGLQPICCPRCSEAFTEERIAIEAELGLCAVCDRENAIDDTPALNDAITNMEFRVAELEKFDLAANESQKNIQINLNAIRQQREANIQIIGEIQKSTERISERRKIEEDLLKAIGALEERQKMKNTPPFEQQDLQVLKILRCAEEIAELRMKQAGTEILEVLEKEVCLIAQRFGFRDLQSLKIRGNGIKLIVSEVSSAWGIQTPGQKLRLRLALVVAMIRLSMKSGYGNHPGVLFIDSPGSEELSDDDLLAMMKEISDVSAELGDLQIFLASARGKHLVSAFSIDHIKSPNENGTIF